jgi:hypothetical protein
MYDTKDQSEVGLSEDDLREIIAKQLRTGQAVYGDPATQERVRRPGAKLEPMDRLMMLRERQRRQGMPVPGREDDLRKQAIMATTQGGSM